MRCREPNSKPVIDQDSMPLQKHGLMHYVNTEFGSLSSGAASMVHTKDASFRGEHGQVSSYVVGVKMVTAEGEHRGLLR